MIKKIVKEGFEATQIWSLNPVKMANGTRPSKCFELKPKRPIPWRPKSSQHGKVAA